jgi:D-glucuronyl C5-epimerase C-terminus
MALRQTGGVALAAAIFVLAVAPVASAAPVLVLEGGHVRTVHDPALDHVVTERAPAGVARACSRCEHRQRALAARKGADPVRRALGNALLRGQIDPAAASRYRSDYSAALRLRKRLPFVRARELGYVIDVLRRFGRTKRLSPARMPALFLTLERNTEWWAANGLPAANTRIRFGNTRLLFQYYPGLGLQIQPLGNFGAANGYWYAHNDSALRKLVDELLAVRVKRGDFTTWEYYFAFGGGSPPWISGMAQGTAVQALARAGTRLADPSIVDIARDGLTAFQRQTPTGVRVPDGDGAWYPLYSFAPKLEVLNGMLQALIGLNTYAELTGDARAAALFADGDRLARARIGAYDTGAWSLYSRSGGRPGAEASLNYHTLNRDFAQRLCKATKAERYCTAADNFSRYLSEDPTLTPFGPSPSPARAGRGVRFHFRLSKIGRAGIVVSAGSRTYLSTSAVLAHGDRYFRWVPPRLKTERTYDYRLFARDLAGNTTSEQGTIRVKPVPKRGQ